MKQDYTNYKLTMADGQEKAISQCTVKEMLQWLDDIPNWCPDEVEAVFTECADRLGMYLDGFWDCDECFDALRNAFHDEVARTDVDSLKLHVDGGRRAIGPLVTFKRVDTDKLPEGCKPVKLDGENSGRDMDIACWFEFYGDGQGHFFCVRKEI